MSVKDWTIYRIYKCDKCEIEVGTEQLASDPWLKTCPNCGADEMYIKEAKAKASIQVNGSSPKTIGMLAQKNTERLAKEGKLDDTPRFKPKKKINFDILKNPKRYIETGKI